MTAIDRIDADVCIVGAGAGGAVAAAELAEGGAKVVVLEQGPRHDADRFSARPVEMMTALYRDGGQGLTLGTPPILLPLGRGHRRHHARELRHLLSHAARGARALAREYGLRSSTEQALDPCFERVERALVGRRGDAQSWRAPTRPSRAAAREALGWSHGYLRRNARGCVGSGVCAFGCPTSAKQHTGITYVPRAQAAGAQILTGAEVHRVLVRDGRARGVQAQAGRGRTSGRARPRGDRRGGHDPHAAAA